MDNSVGCQEEDKSRYDGLKNAEFLKVYFRDHGITDEEITLYATWDGFLNLGKGIENDEEGMNYARNRVESIIAYRDMTIDDLRKNYDRAPWAWPSAMSFQELCFYSPDRMRGNVKGRDIYLCVYDNERFFLMLEKKSQVGKNWIK